MKYSDKQQIEEEASIIREEMKSMTTEEISKEVEKLRSSAVNNQRVVLFSMELQKRILWERKFKNSQGSFR
ncbi:MAG: hypothetical protein K6F04_02675 [bacterium]|nr:hypothetical protein [bacterium]